MTDFTEKTIAVVRRIPRGKVATYGQIAALAGKPHAARGVSWILHSGSRKHALPWQRVLGGKGTISFPRGTPEFTRQRNLLLREGIAVSADGAVALAEYQWARKAKRVLGF